MKRLVVNVNEEKMIFTVLSRKLAKMFMKEINDINRAPEITRYKVLSEKSLLSNEEKEEMTSLEPANDKANDKLEGILVKVVRQSLAINSNQKKFALSSDEKEESKALDLFDEMFSYEDLSTFSGFALTGKIPKEDEFAYSDIIDLTE